MTIGKKLILIGIILFVILLAVMIITELSADYPKKMKDQPSGKPTGNGHLYFVTEWNEIDNSIDWR